MKGIIEQINETFSPRNLIIGGICGYVLAINLDACGTMDSPRTIEASRLEAVDIKSIKSVEEILDDPLNPRVRRYIEFDDGTKTTLRYMTKAWSFIRDPFQVDMFAPNIGEEYWVTEHNTIVKRYE